MVCGHLGLLRPDWFWPCRWVRKDLVGLHGIDGFVEMDLGSFVLFANGLVGFALIYGLDAF